MLMTIGPVVFEVWPFAAMATGRDTQSDHVEKPVMGRRPRVSRMGEIPVSDDNDEAGEIERSRRVIEVDLTAVPSTAAAAANALIERQRAVEIADMAAVARRMGVTVDLTRALELAVDPGALGAAVLAAAAARDEATAVVSAAPTPKLAAGPADAKPSPIVAIARERADAAERKRGNR